MQFHLNGYNTGDPDVKKADSSVVNIDGDSLPPECDVLIVGCGPAGLTLAAQLAAFPDIKTCIVDQKSGALERGQADGVACRTMEMFNAFGFVHRVLREAYWVNETSFWRPDSEDASTITRGGWIKDTEAGLSEFPHVILNQARVHQFYLDVMSKSSTRLTPHYSRQFVDLTIAHTHASKKSADEYPVTASFKVMDGGEQRVEEIKARYVVGCDGARSNVRRALNVELKGDSTNTAWGVMDILAVTDFPDIRFKSIINSADEGSIVLIPREGGYMVRLYVEIDKLKHNERVASRNLTAEDVIAGAQRIMHPYTLDVKEIAWWSVYEVGQRLCDRFDDVPEDQTQNQNPRVFIAGDACHTHSPKAGQGMNVSMQDAYNLGWKLASVLRRKSPSELLHTYSAERQAVAKELIDFDREWAAMLHSASNSDDDTVDPSEVQGYFVKSGQYTAGTATRYAPSVLTGDAVHRQLATGFVIGKRFHSAPVVRMADGKPMQLGHVNQADGRWRLFAFADDGSQGDSSSKVASLCQYLAESDSSPLIRYTPEGHDIDSVIDVRVIFQQPHREVQGQPIPELLRPPKGIHGLRDYEKIFCPDFEGGENIFSMRGVNRTTGCIIIVRPDQYIANLLPLDGYAELAQFFDRFMLPARKATVPQQRLEASI